MSRTSTLPKRLQPMLATLTDAPFDDPGWIFEDKYDGFRMIVQNSVGAGTFYDLEYKSTDYFENRLIPYQPSPHFAYLGGNDQREGPENGSFPGEIVRNVFIGNRPRPASLGSALRVQ